MSTALSDTSAVLFMDRFVSATSADDARSSLEQILDALSSNQIPVSALINDSDFLDSLLQLLESGRHKQSIPVEEGPTLVCRILLQVLAQQKARQGPSLLTLPSPGRLFETLLDVASADSNSMDDGIPIISTYTRVLALQLLMKLSQMHGSTAQTQLLSTPNGLHRLAELLSLATDDQVRNEALLLAKIVSKWPSCAKLWIFSDVAELVMKLAVAEGGLTKGNVLVLDCLEVLANLVKHEASTSNLLWQTPVLASNLMRLMDLRGGTNFMNPTTPAAKPKLPLYDDDDDLDAILNSATSNKLKEDVEPEVYIPKLTDAEEQVMVAVLDVLAVMLGSEANRSMVWQSHGQLCRMVWDLALMGPPLPNTPYFCAMPSARLQQKAMETVALYFADSSILERIDGLDRLFMIVCTGMGGASEKEFLVRMGLSQAALHVIRRTLTTDAARELVLFSLAPPMTEDLSGPPPPTAVLKLLNTVAGNLQLEELRNDEVRRLFLIGALGALTLFLVDDTSREMMLRLTSGPAAPPLIDSLLESLAALDSYENDGDVIASILRFLGVWMMDTPPVVQAVLSSTQSTALGVLAASNHKIASTMSVLLLGIAMEFMGAEEKCGGWTRSSLMETIGKKKGGVSANATLLEQFKSYKTDLPWAECGLEWQVWSTWYSSHVLVVRRRFVQELMGGAEQDKEDHDDHDESQVLAPSDGRAKVKSLQSLVSQQSQELEELRESLAKALATTDAQQTELEVWKRRAESTPMQVDDILNEYKSKNTELEATFETLKADMVVKQDEFQSQLQEKDKSIAAVQSELAESQERERETGEERDRLREELEGLTSAYNTLEEEFQRVSEAASRSATAAPTGERGDETRGAEQPEGEDSEQTPVAGGGSTEVSALRADNARVRQDLQNAEDWIKMAVDRMSGFLSQIATDEAEIKSLQAQLEEARSDQSSQANEVLQKLHSEQERMNGLMSQIATNEAELESLRAQLEQARYDRSNQEEVIQRLRSEQEASQQLRQQLGSLIEHIHFLSGDEQGSDQSPDALQHSQMNILSAVGELEKFQSIRQELFQKLDATTNELEYVRENASRESAELHQLVEEEREKLASLEDAFSRQHSEWENVVGTKDLELQALRDQVNELLRNLEDSSSALGDVQNLTATVAALENQLKAARDEAVAVHEKEQAEIYKREAKIRELQAMIGHTQGRFTLEDIEARDEEILQLRAANDAAQEWMQKAVEQHANLTGKMAVLVEQNANLSKQLREAKAQVLSLTNESAKVHELERRTRDLEDTAAQLTATKAELTEREHAVEQLEADLKVLRGQLQQSKWTEEELARANEQINSLRSELEASVQLREESIRWLETELETTKARVVQLENERTVAVNDSVTVQSADGSRVAELENEIVSVTKSLRAATESEHALRKELDVNRLELERKTAELSSAISDVEKHYHQTLILTEMVDKLEAERQKLGGHGESTPHDTKSLAVRVLELEQAALESQQLLAQLQEAKADLRRDEDIVHQWEERVAELEATISDLEKQLADQETEASNVISLWQDSCANLDKENSQLKAELEAGVAAIARVKELEATMTEREKESSEVISQWSERSAAFERENLQMKEEVATFKERVADLEAAVTELERQVGEKDTEMDKVVSRWQDTCAAMESENTKLKVGVADGIEAKERLAELEAAINDLEKQLVEQEQEASAVIAQWEARCESYEIENAQFQEQVTVLDTLKTTSEDLAKRLASQEFEANNTISELQKRCSSLEAGNAKLTEESHAGIALKLRVVELEASVSALENQLVEQERAAQLLDVVKRWEDTCKVFENENVQLREEIAIASDRLAELDATVKEMEKQLAEQENEANIALSQWEERCSALENQVAQLTEEALTIKSKSTDRTEEPNTTVKELENQLAEQEHEANIALTQWEERCLALESEIAQIKGETTTIQPTDRVGELIATVKALENQLAEQEHDANVALTQWEERCLALESEIAQIQGDTTTITSTDKVEELISTVKALENQLAEQENEANIALSKWEERCSALGNEIAQLKDEIATIKSTDGAEALHATVQELETQLTEQENEANIALAQWEERCSAFEIENAQLRDEVTSMHAQKQSLKLETTTRELETQPIAEENVSNDTVSRWQARCSAYEYEIAGVKEEIAATNCIKEELLREKMTLEQKLVQQEEQNRLVVTDVQAHLASLESRCLTLENELQVSKHDKEALLKGVERVKAKMTLLEAACDEKDRKIVDLEKMVLGSTETLKSEKEALSSELDGEKKSFASVKLEVEALHFEIARLKDALKEWEVRCLAAEQANTELSRQLEAERDSSKAAQETNTETKEKAAQETNTETKEKLDSLIRELSGKDRLIESVRRELERERNTRATSRVHGDKDLQIPDVNDEVDALKAEIDAITAESEDAVNQWKDRVVELEAMVGELEDQLDQANSAANDAISCWETRYEELGNTIADTERSGQESLAKVVALYVSELQNKDNLLVMLGKSPEAREPLPEILSLPYTAESIDSFVAKAKSVLLSVNEAVTQAIEHELKLSQNELQTQNETIQATTALLEEKIQQLQDTLDEKDSTIANLDEEVAAAKERMQSLEIECRHASEQAESEKRNRIDAKAVCEALQAVHAEEKSSLEAIIGTEKARRMDLERRLDEQKRQVDKLEQEVTEYQSRADMLQIERGRIEDALTKEKILENEQIETWRQECDILKKEVEMERERWSTTVGQLEEELRQSNDTLQSFYTDEVSERATAAVAEALRTQVEEMQIRLHECRNELAKEKDSREAIEKEAKRLKADLATLLAMDGNEINDVDLVAFKASDRIQRKEREEIEELRKVLARSQQELTSLRATNNDADDRATKARLQASICEQELVSAKADLKFLAQTMEEMREAEETRRASLEHRINALEDDHEVLRRFHADEVESLRNDLTQVSLEKDRVLHSLKESEKALTALMFASSQGSEKDGIISSPKAELMKLRIEKEQMLAAAEEEASNVEKRIREAIGAHASSLEADVILERELRIAAEAALDNTRAEMAELRRAIERSPSKGSASPAATADKLKSELQRCSQEIQKLAEENSSLRAELDRATADAKATINKLTEQCRKAQVRAHKLECDNRSDSEMKTEVTRLRLEERDDDVWHSSNSNGHNPAEDFVEDHVPTSSKAFDMLQQQKEAIHEERQLYLELLAEHDDLLALVAQQDIEKESLQAALLQAGGQAAVDEAIKTAEEKSMTQFGKHVKLSQAS